VSHHIIYITSSAQKFKMSSNTNASGERWRNSLTAWPRAVHSLLMRRFSSSTYDSKCIQQGAPRK